MPPDAYSRARQRWFRTHRAFFVLLQCVSLLVQRSCAAVRRGAHDEATEMLRATSSLFRGASAMFQFAGDFSRREYEQDVRPTMSPPRQPEGFSGLWSVDHETMLPHIEELARLLRNPNRALPRTLVDAFNDMLRMEVAVIEEHCRVCAIFGGAEGPSLQGQKAMAPKTAVEVLKKIKTFRVSTPLA